MGWHKQFQSLYDDCEDDGIYKSIMKSQSNNKTYSIPEYGIRKDIAINSCDDLANNFKSFIQSFDKSVNDMICKVLSENSEVEK
ncbi:MAG: hypothetical protein WC748_09785 [Legionellales bacterium]|jgi:hypothetical protein